jgi:hypothetical protein
MATRHEIQQQAAAARLTKLGEGATYTSPAGVATACTISVRKDLKLEGDTGGTDMWLAGWSVHSLVAEIGTPQVGGVFVTTARDVNLTLTVKELVRDNGFVALTAVK